MEGLMTPEQRREFREIQAVMSLLEGFGDYIMDEVGRDLVPDVERHQREVPRAGGEADRLRAGDDACDGHGPQDGAVPQGGGVRSRIAKARGAEALHALWLGPESLPSPEEIDQPSLGWQGCCPSSDRATKHRGCHMTAASLERVGPGHGPGGSPLAIAISPYLTGRDAFGSMREQILEAAPGTRLIPVSADGIADEPLDDVEVLLRGWSLGGEPLDRLVGRAPKLRWIHSVSVGVESVLTPCTLVRGLTVTNGRGVFDQPIAEYVMTMILGICRRLPQLLELAARADLAADRGPGNARADDRPGGPGRHRVRGGQAHTAVRFEDRGHPAAAGVGPGRRRGGPRRNGRVAGAARCVRLRGACGAAHHRDGTLIDDAALWRHQTRGVGHQRRPRRAVDEGALLRALRSGPLGGAVLDTFREEPLPETSPFYRLSNCIVTPHTSWSSGAVLGRTFDVFCDNLRRYRAGEPLKHVVDPVRRGTESSDRRLPLSAWLR
jgi:hypothetical protein